MKKLSKAIISAIVLISMLFMTFIPSSANSRAQEWYGRDGNGVIIVGDNVPIEVTSELLTFDIPTLPYAKYSNSETFLAYDSKVTAQYTFHNPTDMTITATLLFPFGTFPEYGKGYDSLDKYGVKVNGEKIDVELKHTPYIGDFDAEKDSSLISDDFVTDDFYHPDLTVTKYSYEIGGSKAASESFHIRLSGLNSNQLPVHYHGNLGSYIDTKTGDYYFSNSTTKVGESKTVHFYVFGDPLNQLPDAYWSKANGPDPATEVERYVKFLGTETTTLKDFINNECTNDSVSEVDWYNACIARFKECEVNAKGKRALRNLSLGSLLRWYRYEITIEPGESIINEVTAPMYPVISAWNKPITYEYSYLLSPASNWASFGSLDIVINTPYEMVNCNLVEFTKTESGYRLVRDGLPTENGDVVELFFVLENDGNTPLNEPKPRKSSGFWSSIANFFSNIWSAITSFFARIFNLSK